MSAVHSAALHLNTNATGSGEASDSASQMEMSLVPTLFPAFSSTSCSMTWLTTIKGHDCAFNQTSFPVKYVGALYAWGAVDGCFFASWTSKPQVCRSPPSSNHASGPPTTNENQPASTQRKSIFAAPACECIHCSWRGVALQRLPCIRAIGWDPSR